MNYRRTRSMNNAFRSLRARRANINAGQMPAIKSSASTPRGYYLAAADARESL